MSEDNEGQSLFMLDAVVPLLLTATERSPTESESLSTTLSLVIWGAVTVAVLMYVLWVRSRSTPTTSSGSSMEPLDLTNFISLALSTFAVLSSIRLVSRALTVQTLQTELGEEDLVALVLGAIAVIWVSLKEIRKLLPGTWQLLPTKQAQPSQSNGK
jgi:hypothetical protein